MEDVLSVDRFEKWSNNTGGLRKPEPELLKPPPLGSSIKNTLSIPRNIITVLVTPLSFYFFIKVLLSILHLLRAASTRGVLEIQSGARGAGEDARRLQRLVGLDTKIILQTERIISARYEVVGSKAPPDSLAQSRVRICQHPRRLRGVIELTRLV